MMIGSKERVPSLRESHRYSCVSCHGDAWLSQSGHERVKRNLGSQVICMECWTERRLPKSVKEEKIETYVPTMGEMVADFGLDAALRIQASLQQPEDDYLKSLFSNPKKKPQ